MKLHLSCTDFSFPLLDHDRALAMIALLGLRGVDIGLFEGHGHLKPGRELLQPARNGAALKRAHLVTRTVLELRNPLIPDQVPAQPHESQLNR